MFVITKVYSNENNREVKKYIRGWDDNSGFQKKDKKDYEFGEPEIFYEVVDNHPDEKIKDYEWMLLTYQHKEVLDYFISDFNDKEKYKLVFEIMAKNPDFDKKTCYRIAIECHYTELTTKHLTYISDTIKENEKFLDFRDELRRMEEIKNNLESTLTIPKNCTESHINCCEVLRKVYLKDVKKLRDDVVSKTNNEIRRLNEQKNVKDTTVRYFIYGVIVTVFVTFLALIAPYLFDIVKKWLNW